MSNKVYTKELAKYYDLLYSFKDYESESKKIKILVNKYKKSQGNELLEVACGTGQHTQYLKNSFTVVATDLSRGMLDVARKNFPNIHFHQADMLNLNLGKTFDVIVCLFSSIGYIKNYQNLNKTIKNFAQHLKKGGVVIIEPWVSESSYITGTPGMTLYDGNDIKIARLSVSKKRGIVSIMDMHYLISERDKDTKHFIERHELAMFDTVKFINIMNTHGLQSLFSKKGLMKDRGLYIGIKK